jgi:mannose-6-phosphate isomerase
LRFPPIFKPAIWGGRRLAGMFPGAPAEGLIGEAWVLSDHGDDVSVVADGPLKGTTLRELMRTRRDELLGPSLAHYDTFPLLMKFIDARDNLSVQVHPNDDLAQTLASVPRGKTEAWLVLHAEPGSRIYAGLKNGVDRRRFEQAVADGTVADCLHSFEPRRAGDCIFLPAGTVHALGGGITVFEVQQTCDTTYRLFDWNRVDTKTGWPRELHVERALASTDFARGPVKPTTPEVVEGPGVTVRTVESPYFMVRHTTLESPFRFDGFAECRTVIALRGGGAIRHETRTTPLKLFVPVLVPPGQPIEVLPDGKVSFLVIRPL